MVTKNRIAERK